MWDRYLSGGMAKIWSPGQKYMLWTEIEVEVLRVQSELGLIPRQWGVGPDGAGLDPHRLCPAPSEVAEGERLFGHEMVGFLWALGLEHVHIGLTSSDVMDLATMLQMRDTASLVRDAGRTAADALGRLDSDGVVWARTHGMPAECVPRGHLGDVLAHRMWRAVGGLSRATLDLSLGGKLRGPVGWHNQPVIGGAVEGRVLRRFGMSVDQGAVTQTADRGRWLGWLDALGGVMSAAEQAAVDLRLMSQPGWGWEITPDGAGSSSMPHKANPIQAEQVSGLGRVFRGLSEALRETWATGWGHRDLSGSSVERMSLPAVSALAETGCLQVARAAGRMRASGEGTMAPGGGSFDRQTATLLSGVGYLDYRGGDSRHPAGEEGNK